ncbi:MULTISPECIES: hypothetical protein [unclassified Methanoregula]|uniref:hypothetical protein n=1 Tax=unclassified Methanoregula TaxID=2649730 RepID=UPI0009C7C6D9|nr:MULTISPECIES: hypothetical protein [unclassified Methanoregula]OPX61911.1 MAG: hypothetical protein A4E33_02508 [Methanoregula sp. PtaB.Bin085]OPY34415.1 MAG: hypothetical protein A4E34_01460 [Methanoregula sp. PtaU1.Bin006]
MDWMGKSGSGQRISSLGITRAEEIFRISAGITAILKNYVAWSIPEAGHADYLAQLKYALDIFLVDDPNSLRLTMNDTLRECIIIVPAW